jgi:hypothetical protein
MSVIVSSAADGMPGGTEQHQNHPDDYQDDPESPQNGDPEKVADY